MAASEIFSEQECTVLTKGKHNTQGRNKGFMTAGTYNSSDSNTRNKLKISSREVRSCTYNLLSRKNQICTSNSDN